MAQFLGKLTEYEDQISSQYVLDSLKKEYGNFEYYKLKLESADNKFKGELLKYKVKNLDDYQQRLLYSMAAISDDLVLMNNESEQISCAFSHFVRKFDVSNYAEFIVGFPLNDKRNSTHVNTLDKNKNYDRVIVFNDNIFGNGLIKMRISGDNIKGSPKLIVND